MALQLTVRKWGNSLGVVFPRELVKRRHLKPNKKVTIEVVREAQLQSLVGSLPRRRQGQEFKDLVRAGWS